MDSGAAGHVMIEGMFLRVKLERKTAPKKFVAATGAEIRDLGEKTISGVRAWSNLSYQCRMSSELETLLCWMKRTRTFEILEMEQ